MPIIDFSKATRVFQNGVELTEVYHEGTLVWRKLNPGIYSVVISGSGVQGSEHTCVIDAHGDPNPDVTYQWILNDSPIPYTNSSTYTPLAVMVGKLACMGYATNNVGSARMKSNEISLNVSISGAQANASSTQYDYYVVNANTDLTILGDTYAELLMIGAGGGGGITSGSGDPMGGGGGAGGVIFNPFFKISGNTTSQSAIIGVPAPLPYPSGNVPTGGNTTFLSLNARGGGAGGRNGNADTLTGSDGGSGGGGPGSSAGRVVTAGAPLIYSQGRSGGAGTASGTGANRHGGGGGGIFSNGAAANTTRSGAGGNGMLLSDMFPEDFTVVTSALSLTGNLLGFGAGGGGGTNHEHEAAFGGSLGGGDGGNTSVFASNASSWGSGGGGGGDNIAPTGSVGYQGLMMLAVPKEGHDVNIRLWVSDDVYRDDDGNPSTCAALLFTKKAIDEDPRISLGGFVLGDCKVGAQWLLINPDSTSGSMPSEFNDGDTRYNQTTQNHQGCGNVWFYDNYYKPAHEDVLPDVPLYFVYEADNVTKSVWSYNFSPVSSSDIHPASLALANDIINAVAAVEPTIVVYSAGGGANIAAEALAYLQSVLGYNHADLMEHFAVIQHGRNNWTLGYDVRGGVDSRNLTRDFTIAVTNQNSDSYENGWRGPKLDTAIESADLPNVNVSAISSTLNTALRIALGADTAPSTGNANVNFSSTRDISDAGSHVFGITPPRVFMNMPARMYGNETLTQETTEEHLIYNPTTGTYRTRVLWHGLRRPTILSAMFGE